MKLCWNANYKSFFVSSINGNFLKSKSRALRSRFICMLFILSPIRKRVNCRKKATWYASCFQLHSPAKRFSPSFFSVPFNNKTKKWQIKFTAVQMFCRWRIPEIMTQNCSSWEQHLSRNCSDALFSAQLCSVVNGTQALEIKHKQEIKMHLRGIFQLKAVTQTEVATEKRKQFRRCICEARKAEEK